jgi:type II secretory pathway pseudopilin PulG
MPFQFTCPYCYKKTLVDESLVGQSGACISCGKNIVVPEPPRRPKSAFDRAAVADLVEANDPPTSPALSLGAAAEKQAPAWWAAIADRGHKLLRKNWLASGIKLVALLVGIATMSGLAFYVFGPVLSTLKTRRDKAACMANLIQIASALNAYASIHGTYPPPVVYDANGKAMHSWRVLILKELGQTALYNRYNFDEPWDSPSNVRFIGQHCPDVYISPAIPGGKRNVSETNYFLITGPGTLFPAMGPLGPKLFSDDPGTTLLVVESDTRLVEWSKPVDIDITKLNPRIGASGPDTIGGTHSGGAAAAFADGTPAWLPDDLASTVLQAIISPSGNETVNPNQFQLR